MKINVFDPNLVEGESECFDDIEVEAHINFFADCDCVLDIGSPFSRNSKIYSPKLRAIIMSEKNLQSLNLAHANELIAGYYQLAIYSLEPFFRGLPQVKLRVNDLPLKEFLEQLSAIKESRQNLRETLRPLCQDLRTLLSK